MKMVTKMICLKMKSNSAKGKPTAITRLPSHIEAGGDASMSILLEIINLDHRNLTL